MPGVGEGETLRAPREGAEAGCGAACGGAARLARRCTGALTQPHSASSSLSEQCFLVGVSTPFIELHSGCNFLHLQDPMKTL